MLTMVIGVSINSCYDLSFNYLGLFYGLLGSVFTAFYTIFVGRKQEELDLNNMQLIYYQAPLSSIFLFVIICFNSVTGINFTTSHSHNLGNHAVNVRTALVSNTFNNLTEHDQLNGGTPLDILLESESEELQNLATNDSSSSDLNYEVSNFQNLTQNITAFSLTDSLEFSKILPLILTGIAAYTVNISSFWIIGNSSVLTYCVFAKVKLCATVISGVIFFDDIINTRQGVGILICLLGVIYYSYEKYLEKVQAAQKLKNLNAASSQKLPLIQNLSLNNLDNSCSKILSETRQDMANHDYTKHTNYK